jgi:hypothetical protein
MKTEPLSSLGGKRNPFIYVLQEKTSFWERQGFADGGGLEVLERTYQEAFVIPGGCVWGKPWPFPLALGLCRQYTKLNQSLVRLSKREWNREGAGVPRTQLLGITRPGDQGVEEPSRPPESYGAKFLS